MTTRLLPFLLALTLLCVAGCPTTSRQTPEVTPQPPRVPADTGGVIRLPLELAPTDDAVTRMDLTDPRLFALARAIELPLLRNQPDGVILPGLATAWDSPDGVVWTLKLQVFGEASTLPGEALLRSWERILRGEEAELRAQLTDLLAGAADYADGRGESIAGLELDGDTLTIRLTRPNYVFPLWVGQPGLGLTNVATLGQDAELEYVPPGPFRAAAFPPALHAENTFLLQRNDQQPYGKALADELHFVLEPDRDAQLELFRSGDLHTSNLSVDGARVAPSDERLGPTLVRHATASPVVCILDQGDFPWGDQQFQGKLGLRKALNWGIDRASISEALGNQIAPWSHYFPPPLRSYIDPGLLGAPLFGLTPQLQDARRGLLEADHDQGSNLPRGMVLAHPDNPFDRQLMIETGIYFDEISVRLRPFPADREELRGLLELGTHEVTVRHLRPAYPDPDALIYPHLYGGISALGGNWSRINADDLNELIRQTQAQTDATSRQKAFQQLSRLIEERALFVVIGYDTPSLLVSPKLAGYQLNPYDFDASLAGQDFALLGQLEE